MNDSSPTDADLIDAALSLCVEAHRGQRDKAGAAYALHPIRIMMKFSAVEHRVVALLHDVVEDAGVTADALRARGFPESIVEGVLAMTRREGETYEEFVARAARHPVARLVKKADMEDNLDLLRLGELEDRDVQRIRKYLSAYRIVATA